MQDQFAYMHRAQLRYSCGAVCVQLQRLFVEYTILKLTGSDEYPKRAIYLALKILNLRTYNHSLLFFIHGRPKFIVYGNTVTTDQISHSLIYSRFEITPSSSDRVPSVHLSY